MTISSNTEASLAISASVLPLSDGSGRLDKDFRTADEKFGNILNAINPDLTAFHRSGGKLILHHGWSDAAVAPENTVNYYESVVKNMGEDSTRQFVRLFMVHGMEHCNLRGAR